MRNFFKNSSLCSFFTLHAFYELEQRVVLFFLANGGVRDKKSAKSIRRYNDLK